MKVAETSTVTTLKASRWHLGRVFLFGVSIHLTFLCLLLVEFLLIFFSSYSVLSSTGVIEEAAHIRNTGFVERSLSAAAIALFFIVCFIGMGLYSSRSQYDIRTLLVKFGASLILIDIASLAIEYLTPYESPVSLVGFNAVILGVLFVFVARYVFHTHLSACVMPRAVAILGSGRTRHAINELKKEQVNRSYEIVFEKADISPVKTLAMSQVSDLLEQPDGTAITELVLPGKTISMLQKSPFASLCKERGVEVISTSTFYERESGKCHLGLIEGSENLDRLFRLPGNIAAAANRLMDIAVALFGLLLTWPILVIVTLCIKMESKWNGPIFFVQTRVGRNGQPFSLYKFRSMCTDAECEGKAQWASLNDDRVTRVGSFIRKYRIDEVPQLVNVLKGDMSIVGPRPERPEFVNQLAEKNSLYDLRHKIKPGLTGWAQICFQYGASDEESMEKLRYDLYYLKYKSIVLDLTIMLQTLETLVLGKGAR